MNEVKEKFETELSQEIAIKDKLLHEQNSKIEELEK